MENKKPRKVLYFNKQLRGVGVPGVVQIYIVSFTDKNWKMFLNAIGDKRKSKKKGMETFLLINDASPKRKKKRKKMLFLHHLLNELS